MNWFYSIPLFEPEDIAEAYSYFYNGHSKAALTAKDMSRLMSIMGDRTSVFTTIIRANMKMVYEFSHDNLYPYINSLFKAKGYKEYGFINLDTEAFLKAVKDQDIISDTVDSTFATNVAWFYFKPKRGDIIEQVIKARPYSEYMSKNDDGVIFMHLTPHDTFAYIFDFIDDLFEYL